MFASWMASLFSCPLFPASFLPPYCKLRIAGLPLCPRNRLVSAQIFVCCSIPRIIGQHAVALNVGPRRFVIEEQERFVKFLGQTVSRVIVKLKAVALFRAALEIRDRIVQSAHAAHNRHCADGITYMSAPASI